MIDRKARDQTITAIEEYLDDKLSAFDFDDRLSGIESDDQTVNEIVQAAWYSYDDCTDHKVVLSKQGWDYFQRLLLILKSDAELSSSVVKRWSWDHALAMTALGSFVGLAFLVGWGSQIFILAVPFGVISILINVYRRRRSSELSGYEIACIPFDSYSQIRWLRHQVPAFRKRQYRTELQGRKIRSPAAELFTWAISYCHWIAFSPFVLLFQGFPSQGSYRLRLRASNKKGRQAPR